MAREHGATTKPASGPAHRAVVETGTDDHKATDSDSEEELDWVDSPRAQPTRSLSALSELSSLSADSTEARLSPFNADAIRCQWSACGLTLASARQVLDHVRDVHAKPGPGDQACDWNMCGKECISTRGMVQHVKGTYRLLLADAFPQRRSRSSSQCVRDAPAARLN